MVWNARRVVPFIAKRTGGSLREVLLNSMPGWWGTSSERRVDAEQSVGGGVAPAQRSGERDCIDLDLLAADSRAEPPSSGPGQTEVYRATMPPRPVRHEIRHDPPVML